MRTSFVSVAMMLALAGAANAQFTGPNSSNTPYVLGTRPGVITKSIVTVGDTVTKDGGGKYRLVGIPDGSGGFPSGKGLFTLVVNHELGNASGIPRAHGQTGAFVSRWIIESSTLGVVSARDLNTAPTDSYEYLGAGVWSNTPSPTQRWARFCSGDTAAASAFVFDDNGTIYGTDARIHLNGEENGNEGRGYAHIVTGPEANQTWAIPALGKASWENLVANPYAQRKTIVVGTDDTTPGQVYVYVGEKQATGNTIEKAGLTNGNFYGVRVPGLPLEQRGGGASGRFELHNFGNVSEISGATIQADSVTNGVTEFLRPEDSAWDPRAGHHNDLYLLTTDRFDAAGQTGRSRLYRLRFDDVTDPTLGGEITMLASTLDGPQMMDNLCVDGLGRVIIQEDIGNNAQVGKLWMYDTASSQLVQIAQHDPNRFVTGAPNFLTVDEESSGIFDAADILGQGWFLLVVQAHYGIPGELVEGGQMIAMYIDPALPNTRAVGISEAIAGDFSDDRANPRGVELREGSNPVVGAFGAGAKPKTYDRDYLTVTVPAGMSLNQINVLGLEVGGSFAFIGVERGRQMTTDPESGNPATLLGYHHMSESEVGTDILPAIGDGAGAIGFDAPLTAGFYTFWIQEQDTLNTHPYALSFVIGEAECRADFDGNGTVNSTDVSDFINAWFSDQVDGAMLSDFNADGVSNSTDVSDFINSYFEEQGGC